MKKSKHIKLILPRLFLILITISLGIIYFFHKKTLSLNTSTSTHDTIPAELIEQVYDAASQEETYIPESSDLEETIETSPPYVAAWMPYWDFSNALQSYKDNSKIIKSLSPTWYSLQANGSLKLKTTARDAELIKLCKDNQTQLIPSISNANAQELSVILNDQVLLENHINSITQEVETYQYEGIDIDYENIQGGDKEAFTNFIKLLAQKLHSKDKILTIAVLWKNDLDDIIEHVSESRAAQDWHNLASYVDEFRIMAYDYTGSSDMQGPIAPKVWIKSILSYALDKVEIEKIVLGLPLYAYEWTENKSGARALVWSDVDSIKSNTNYVIIEDLLDLETTEKKLRYEQNSIRKIIWYQDSEVTCKRIELAQSYGINKFVFWRLGGEDNSLFEFAKATGNLE